MAGMRTLRDLFESELRDVYDAEKQNSQSVAENDQGRGDGDLRAPLKVHLKETRGHATRLEKAFRSLDLWVRAGNIVQGWRVSLPRARN